MKDNEKFEIGQKVQYRSGSSWKPTGVVIDIMDGLRMNSAVLISPSYKVRWDDGDESGWLSYFDIIKID